METFTVRIGKSPNEMTFGECMAHVTRVMYWDPIDGEWVGTAFEDRRRWDLLAGQLRDAHEREIERLRAENAELSRRNEELQADVVRLFLSEVGRWTECMQREMEEG